MKAQPPTLAELQRAIVSALHPKPLSYQQLRTALRQRWPTLPVRDVDEALDRLLSTKQIEIARQNGHSPSIPQTVYQVPRRKPRRAMKNQRRSP